jgi:hypothetical protein
MNFQHRLGRLEVLVQGETPPPPEPTPEGLAWLDQLSDASATVLATMPEHRARAAVATFRAGRWDDPIVRRVLELARAAIPAADPSWYSWLPWELRGLRPRIEGPRALPEGTCALLDAHSNTIFESYTCERCGYQAGERLSSEWRAEWVEGGRIGEPRRSFVDRCPMPECGGLVRHSGYQLSCGLCIQVAQSPAWGREHNIRCPHPENECPGDAWAKAYKSERNHHAT